MVSNALTLPPALVGISSLITFNYHQLQGCLIILQLSNSSIMFVSSFAIHPPPRDPPHASTSPTSTSTTFLLLFHHLVFVLTKLSIFLSTFHNPLSFSKRIPPRDGQRLLVSQGRIKENFFTAFPIFIFEHVWSLNQVQSPQYFSFSKEGQSAQPPEAPFPSFYPCGFPRCQY